MLRSWINERIFFCLSLSLFSKQWVGRTMGNETFSVRHCHGIYDIGGRVRNPCTLPLDPLLVLIKTQG